MPRGRGETDPSIAVPQPLMALLQQRAGATITCAECFDIAQRFGVARRVVGEAANRAQVRIVQCQLGCFD